MPDLKLRLQTTWQIDTALPTDRFQINPCFRINGSLYDPDALCEDLATALKTWAAACPFTSELTVKSYDLEGTPPVYPNGEAKRDVGVIGTSSGAREVALCLSFYADHNRPRQRGRLYIPHRLIQSSGPTISLASSALMTRVAQLVPIFEGLGGVNVDWIVWSKTDHVARKVTNWFVDDAWDTVRSRGAKATTRQTGTTSG